MPSFGHRGAASVCIALYLKSAMRFKVPREVQQLFPDLCLSYDWATLAEVVDSVNEPTGTTERGS